MAVHSAKWHMASDATTECNSCVFRHDPFRAYGRREAPRPTEADMHISETTPYRRTARIAGILFLITFIASIPALALFQPVLDDPAGWIAGTGGAGRLGLGALLELVTILANVGTAIVLFPLLRRTDEALSLGYIGARVVECTFMAVGLVSVLAIVSLQ